VEYEQRGEDRARYGSRLLASLSNRLKVLGIKGNSSTRLKLYRSFYQQHKEIGPTVPDQSTPLSRLLGTFPIRPTASDQSVLSRSEPFSFEAIIDLLISRFTLGWSHYVTLLTIDNPDERQFYEIEASRNSWSVRELERQIASSLYERLALSRDKNDIRRLAREGQVVEKAADIIKNPFVLEFLGLEERPAYSENELESAIIDLKRDKLTHQDLGQMQMYVNYFDRHVKLEDELPTVGIILCRRKNDTLVELTLPKEANIFASKYQLYLPSKQELKTEVEKVQAELETGEKTQ
jgi:hypothetical protein